MNNNKIKMDTTNTFIYRFELANFEKEVSSIICKIRRILGVDIPYQMKIQKTELKEICELVDQVEILIKSKNENVF